MEVSDQKLILFDIFLSALEDERLTADEMDEQRKRNIAYEYLCHLEEAKM